MKVKWIDRSAGVCEHFGRSMRVAATTSPLDEDVVMDDDLKYAAYLMYEHGSAIEQVRDQAVEALLELKRRWAPVTARIKACQSAALRMVTASRDLGQHCW